MTSRGKNNLKKYKQPREVIVVLVLKGIFGGSLKITSEYKNNFRGKNSLKIFLRFETQSSVSFLGLTEFRVRGFSQFVLFLFLGLLRAPTGNSPERVRDTIWTFPEKSVKPPGLETPRLASLN